MIRVSVVDDHPVFRQGLAHAVEAADDFELVAAVASVEDLVATPEADLVILDLGLPGTHGPDAVRLVCQGGAKVLVVSAGGGQKDVLEPSPPARAATSPRAPSPTRSPPLPASSPAVARTCRPPSPRTCYGPHAPTASPSSRS